jgi:hypothetical protein
MNTSYYLEVIEEILETALYTSCIRDSIPVSLILVGDSGVAKSKLLMRLQGSNIHVTDSFTSQGLFELAASDRDNKIQFIVTPDLNPTMSRKATTVQSTISNLLSFTTDGTVRVDDGRREKVAEHKPVGFLTACTPMIWDRQAKRWFALGLRRRIIPIFFSYTQSTVNSLLELVRKGKINASNFNGYKFEPKTKSALPIISPEHALELESAAKDFSVNLGRLSFLEHNIKKWFIAKVIPISPLVTLQTLCRAHAVRENRTEVSEKDVQFTVKFIEFTNPEAPKQI